MEEKNKISVGMFYANGIMKHLIENKGNSQIIFYKNSGYPLNLKLDSKTLKHFRKDKGLLACAFVKNGNSFQVVSTYFSRNSENKLSPREAYTFGHEIGEVFNQGSRDYELVKDYDFSLGKKFPRAPLFLVDFVNLSKNKSKFNAPNKIEGKLMVPCEMENLENICEGISDGQKRISSKKTKKLVPFF